MVPVGYEHRLVPQLLGYGLDRFGIADSKQTMADALGVGELQHLGLQVLDLIHQPGGKLVEYSEYGLAMRLRSPQEVQPVLLDLGEGLLVRHHAICVSFGGQQPDDPGPLPAVLPLAEGLLVGVESITAVLGQGPMLYPGTQGLSRRGIIPADTAHGDVGDVIAVPFQPRQLLGGDDVVGRGHALDHSLAILQAGDVGAERTEIDHERSTLYPIISFHNHFSRTSS